MASLLDYLTNPDGDAKASPLTVGFDTSTPMTQPQSPAQPQLPAAAVATAPVPQNDPDTGAPVSPTPNAFQPTQITPHQAYIDRALMKLGRHPVYQTIASQQDFTRAMQNYDQDPLGTINNIAKIPNMGDVAYKMHEDYTTNQERDDVRKTQVAARQQLGDNQIGAMANAVLMRAQQDPKSADATYAAMKPQMERVMKRWNLDPSEYNLPDSYDETALSALAGGSLSTKDQNSEALRSQSMDNRETYNNEREDLAKRTLELRQAAEDDRERRFQQDFSRKVDDFRKLHPDTKTVPTPQGQMELSPSGITGRIGDQIWQKVAPGKWTRIK